MRVSIGDVTMANLEVTRTPIRLGQSAITLRTQNAGYIPAISDLTYRDRTQKRTWLSYKGARPIHRTTLTLDRSKPKLDYVTLYKYVSITSGLPKHSGLQNIFFNLNRLK